MEIDDLVELDTLWRKTFPYLVDQIRERYAKSYGSVLELGPFSGGISLELARLYPGFEITIAEESPEVVEYLRAKILASGSARRIAVKKTDLNNLAFDDCQFDLVVFRGAFFFLTKKEDLLKEIFRVLRQGGFAFVGGGHGKGVPLELINEIADRLRQLHRKLGGRRVSIEELQEIVSKSQLTDNCEIIEEGGLWLYLRK